MARLMIQRPGEAPEPTDEVGALGATADALASLAVAPDGLVVEARCGARAGGRALPPGVRRLVRRGERVDAGGCAVWLEPEARADETRALAGAVLSGAAAPPLCGPTLLAIEGPAAGARLPVADGAVLGRGAGVTLRLEDPLASRRHLRLSIRGGAVYAEDLASKNGLALGGRRHRRVRLALGDALTVGATVLVLLAGPEPGTPPPGRATTPRPRVGFRSRIAWAALAAGLLWAAALALAAAGA